MGKTPFAAFCHVQKLWGGFSMTSANYQRELFDLISYLRSPRITYCVCKLGTITYLLSRVF